MEAPTSLPVVAAIAASLLTVAVMAYRYGRSTVETRIAASVACVGVIVCLVVYAGRMHLLAFGAAPYFDVADGDLAPQTLLLEVSMFAALWPLVRIWRPRPKG